MKGFEKRKDRRLEIKLNLLCSGPEMRKPKLHTGTVINIASGGLYFETAESRFEPGNLTEVSIEVPSQAGGLDFGETMRTTATVVRAEILESSRAGMRDLPLHGVALQFCDRPRLNQ